MNVLYRAFGANRSLSWCHVSRLGDGECAQGSLALTVTLGRLLRAVGKVGLESFQGTQGAGPSLSVCSGEKAEEVVFKCSLSPLPALL